MRVLVADDHAEIRVLVEMLLTGEGMTVVQLCDDGAQALRAWTALGRGGIDAMVLDQVMPGYTGLEVAERVFATEPNFPIVLISASVTEEMREKAARIGVRSVLAKTQITELTHHVKA